MLSVLKANIPRSYKRVVKRILENIWESIIYRLASECLLPAKVNFIIFICKGNICRSAFAEYYMKSYCSDESVRFESCGLDVDQGNGSPLEAVNVGNEFGVKLNVHQSKSFEGCDVREADLIVPMEYKQYVRLIAMFPDKRGKIKLLRDFAPWPQRYLCNIYDPFGLGEDEFLGCFRKMQVALDGLIKYLASKKNTCSL